jgi:endonuclease V-like protein UPF0215 family
MYVSVPYSAFEMHVINLCESNLRLYFFGLCGVTIAQFNFVDKYVCTNLYGIPIIEMVYVGKL